MMVIFLLIWNHAVLFFFFFPIIRSFRSSIYSFIRFFCFPFWHFNWYTTRYGFRRFEYITYSGTLCTHIGLDILIYNIPFCIKRPLNLHFEQETYNGPEAIKMLRLPHFFFFRFLPHFQKPIQLHKKAEMNAFDDDLEIWNLFRVCRFRVWCVMLIWIRSVESRPCINITIKSFGCHSNSNASDDIKF